VSLTVSSVLLANPREGTLFERPPRELGEPDVVFVRDQTGFLGWGISASIDIKDDDHRFARAAEQLTELAARATIRDEVGLPGSGLIALGAFTFTPSTAGSRLIVPGMLLGSDGVSTWLTSATPFGQDPSIRPLGRRPVRNENDRVRFGGSTVDDVRWMDAVQLAIDRIGSGALEKVVLARDQNVWSREPFDLAALVSSLHARFPHNSTFRLDGLVGSSPETLLRRIGDRVTSRVLAGTASRATDPAEDARLADALRSSAKDLHEHALAVDSVRSALESYVGDLQFDRVPHVLKLSNIQHLATDFFGRLTTPCSSLELLGLLHPTAAVAGTPRDTALAVIDELEGIDRGRYAGPVGWTSADGDGEWAIALRCGEFEGDRGRLFAGAGIVTGSRPESELQETRMKLQAMRSALAGHVDSRDRDA
jgi:menaquinone-specific isochorismate synthase